MNAWIKGAMIFAVGALAGASGAYLVLNKQYEERFNQEIADVRDHYRKKILKSRESVKEIVSTEEPKASKLTHISDEEYQKISDDDEKGFVDYTSYAKHDADIPTVSEIEKDSTKQMRDELDKVSKEAHDDDFDEHMAERESPEEDEDNEYDEMLAENERIHDEQERAKNEGIEPYPITRAEYLNQKSWYEKLSWNFYQDGFVTDDGDEKVEAPQLFLGPDLMEAFEMEDDDPDVAYIRDEQRARDIEVCKIAEDFYPKRSPVSGIKLSSEE